MCSIVDVEIFWASSIFRLELSTLKKKGVQNVSKVNQIAHHLIPGDNNLYSNFHENLKSFKGKKHVCNFLDLKNSVVLNCKLAIYTTVIASVVTGNVETVLVMFQVL